MQWYYPFGTDYWFAAGIFLLAGLFYYLRLRTTAARLRVAPPIFLGKFLLRGLYFGLLLVSLLGPSFGKTKNQVKTFSKDIYLLVDLSLSMNATDVQPSRLERAKFEMLQWIETWETDRIGLIVFADEAFVQCPLTFDKNALRLFITALDTRLMPRNGTDLTAALQLALSKLADNQIIVLVSDGEDLSGNFNNVIREIEQRGIHLFATGIGTAAGSRIPWNGQWKKDKQGNTVITRLNPTALQELARQTGGSYAEINLPATSPQVLTDAVAKVAGRVQQVQEIDITANKYEYFLLAALLLLSLDVLITVRVMEL